MREFITKSSEETVELGERVLLEALPYAEKNKPLIFYLSGELGGGKTYFTKGIARALGISSITSPTFVLMKKFKLFGETLRQAQGKKYFIHIDCYRIYHTEDAHQIGLDKIITNPRAIIAIEWAERIAELISEPYWKVDFRYKREGERAIIIDKILSL